MEEKGGNKYHNTHVLEITHFF